MSDRTPSAGEKFGVLGRRTIRRAQPGSKATSDHVGLWDLAVKPGSTAHRLEDVYLKALDAVDRAENRRAEAVKSGKLTDAGLKADVLQFAAQNLAPVLHRGRQQIASAKREVAELRSKIKPQPTDKTDLVSAMLRAEMRDFIRSKPPAERDIKCGLRLELHFAGSREQESVSQKFKNLLGSGPPGSCNDLVRQVVRASRVISATGRSAHAKDRTYSRSRCRACDNRYRQLSGGGAWRSLVSLLRSRRAKVPMP